MRVKCVVVLLLAAVLAGQAPVLGVDTETVDQLTARALKHLTTNTRYAYKADAYSDLPFGKKFGYTAVEGYFGETTGVKRTTEVLFDPKTEKKFGMWVNGDQRISTKKGETGGTVIFRHHVAWASESDAGQFAGFYSSMGLGHYFLPTSASKYGRARNPDTLPFLGHFERYDTSITEVTHRDRSCFKVVFTPPKGSSPFKPIITEYYLDREHGMVVAKRQRGMLHIPKGSRSATRLDVDQVTEITYGPPTANGLPFPTAVKGWFVWPAGRREPMTDVEITEFRRYTPTADELDFEKQFGIPLPALPPKPGVMSSAASGGRVSRWLAGGLAVLVAAAVVVYIRRRQAAGRAAPAPPCVVAKSEPRADE